MDYKYNNGIELLLAHMNIEDIINAAETLYQLEEEERGLSFEEEGLSQEEMDENEDTGDTGRDQKDYSEEVGGVRYGTVKDLLSFVNLLSNMQAAALQHLPEEMGVLLNKVCLSYDCHFVTARNVCVHIFFISLGKLALSSFFFNQPLFLQKDMLIKKGRYQINMDVLLFPWKLTYKNPRSGLVPKGSFGKVHLAQDTATRKRMACKLVSPVEKLLQPVETSQSSASWCQIQFVQQYTCLDSACQCQRDI